MDHFSALLSNPLSIEQVLFDLIHFASKLCTQNRLTIKELSNIPLSGKSSNTSEFVFDFKNGNLLLFMIIDQPMNSL